MDTPVLILAFNRPDAVAQLIRALEPVAPRSVYVALDGPRAHVAEDAARCERVREALTSLSWDHSLNTLVRDTNLGCGRAVSSGIDWFFANEPEGIIIEDDVLPHPSMFPFMTEMLARYRDDDRVVHISGSNYASARGPADYFFSRYVSIWGWATWRRAWKHFSLDISDWRRRPSVLRQPGLHWRARRYLAFAFDRANAGLGNWDYQWKYAVMRHGLAISPSVNLSVTTGLGEDATALRTLAKLPPMKSVPAHLRHPDRVEAEPDVDRELFAEQLARGDWYWEASRLMLPSPRLYHLLGSSARGALSRLARSQ